MNSIVEINLCNELQSSISIKLIISGKLFLAYAAMPSAALTWPLPADTESTSTRFLWLSVVALSLRCNESFARTPDAMAGDLLVRIIRPGRCTGEYLF